MNKTISQLCPLLIVVFALVIALFSSNADSEYPEFLRNLFNEPLFKFVVLVGIVMVCHYHFCCGLLLAIMFVLALNNISALSQAPSLEGFENGSPVSHCGTYDGEAINRVGNAFYPMHDNERVKKVRGGDDKEMDKF